MPLLNKLADKYKGVDDVLFLAPALDDTRQLEKFLAKWAFTYKVVPGAGKATREDFRIST